MRHSGANGLNRRTSWVDAFRELSTALALVDDYSEIWVAAGTYFPGDVRSESFVLLKYSGAGGGFKGNENSSSDRNFAQNQTVLSGNIGDSSRASDGSFHVIVLWMVPFLMGLSLKMGMPPKISVMIVGKAEVYGHRV